jgi:intracellular sulfur oxidation DsrE/DsrF family protein
MLLARLSIFACLLYAAVAATDDKPGFGPVIEDYGPTFAVADRDVPLRDGFHYKLVFDARAYPGERYAVNVELETVARFLNMHARNGVESDDMDLAVVLHGDALSATLTNAAYRQHFDVDNPNLELLQRLHDAGVRFYACGQTAKFRKYARSDLAPAVQIALSAMTMFATLQADGYSLLP